MLYWWDPRYLLFTVPALLLALIAQAWTRSAYNKGLKVPNAARMTGLDGAKALIAQSGLALRIQLIKGNLTDSYDPRNDTLNLSQGVASSASVGALAVVAHELGHALQDRESYAPMRIRSLLVTPVNIGTQLGFVLFGIGFALSSTMGLSSLGRILSWAGVAGFMTAVVFALITLPVEFNASRRGLALLADSGLVGQSQMRYARNVLRGAALTYVAALAQALGQLLYFLMMLSGSRRRR